MLVEYRWPLLPPKYKRRLKKLTTPNGWMRQLVGGELDPIRCENLWCLLSLKRTTIAGWLVAMATPLTRKHSYFPWPEQVTEISVYVAPRYRRLGVATSLIKNAQQLFPPPYLAFPDKESAIDLYKKNGVMVWHEIEKTHHYDCGFFRPGENDVYF